MGPQGAAAGIFLVLLPVKPMPHTTAAAPMSRPTLVDLPTFSASFIILSSSSVILIWRRLGVCSAGVDGSLSSDRLGALMIGRLGYMCGHSEPSVPSVLQRIDGGTPTPTEVFCFFTGSSVASQNQANGAVHYFCDLGDESCDNGCSSLPVAFL